MAKRLPKGIQVDTINRNSPFVQQSFDLKRQDAFVTSLGADFKHYKAMPSPIGKKDRGDYRRNDGVDTITSNGMIYKCAGNFTATMTDNQREQRRTGAGALDPSESHLIMPRFYNDKDVADGKRIYLAPGDRLYVASSECREMYIDGYFYGCILLAQAVADGVTKFLCKIHMVRKPNRYLSRVKRLYDDDFVSTKSVDAFKQIWGNDRDTFHHLNLDVVTDRKHLESRAEQCVNSLFIIESELFAYEVRNEKLVPQKPKYWPMSGQDTTAVYLRN